MTPRVVLASALQRVEHGRQHPRLLDDARELSRQQRLRAVAARFCRARVGLDRDAVRALHKELGLDFFEVFVDTPVEECEKRDPKGLYAKARAGEIQGFTGINAPYEAPENAEMVIDTTKVSVQEAVTRCRAMLESSGSGRPRWGRRGYD